MYMYTHVCIYAYMYMYIYIYYIYMCICIRIYVASLVAQMVKNLLQGRRPRFNSRVRKIPWNRKWQPAPVFLPGEFH